MKICFLADGISIHTVRWCSFFSEKGYQVHLITFQQSNIENVTVHFVDIGNVSVKGGNWKALLAVGRIKKIIKNISPDILHAHYATSYGIVGALTGFHPFVITALGTDVLITPFQSKLYKILIRYALRKADWVTAMAEHMKNKIVDIGVNSEKIDVVMFGVDQNIFNRKGRIISEDKFIITSTRNFEPVYNLELFVEALAILKPKIPEMLVNFIGDGTLKQSVEKKIEELGLKEKCKFLGRVPQKTIADTLRYTHVFVSVSFSDGNNVSLNEAMACGAVSVATNIPANQQWVQDGINGFLVPVDSPEILADKILHIYNNFNELQESANQLNSRLINEKASWQKNMDIVIDKYHKLVSK